jgi:hypothetical protein
MVLTALLTLSATGVADEDIQRLASRRIFFGHQSVGADILDGVNDLTAGKLRIREGRSSELLATPGLLHARLGKNEAPRSKVQDFEAALDALDGTVDIAFFKFCYIDFDARTDVDALFTEYLAALHRLEAKYPKVTFVHLTVPLTVVSQGARAWLKKTVLKQQPWGAAENAARHRFNTLLRTKLSGRPLFDLAALESSRADGSSVSYAHEGQTLPALATEYSDDGQHLNSVGQRRVAGALLTFLARLP